MNAIEIKGLSKIFDERTAVDTLDLTIKQGEFFGLLGSNGAGKTTTIKMLCCLIQPTNGDALMMGNSIVKNSEAVKQIINVSPQETAVAPKLTVRENLEMIARIHGSSKEQATQKAGKMLSVFDMQARARDRAKALSGGFQRKLSIAMALITEPQILFLDEPSLGLDVRARRELWKTINALKGIATIILTTHYLEEAEALSDRICIMDKGKVQIVGTAKEIIGTAGTKTFEDAFLMYTEEGAL